MEDDDDLEVLRLMALKTLHKKENAPTQQSKNLPPPPHQQQQVEHQPINTMVNHTIPVLNNIRLPMDNNYYPAMDSIQSNIIGHSVPPFVNSGFEKMDINEPYVPQRIHPTSTDPFIGFLNYVPSSTTATATAIGEPNVQLSPRAAAFVLANKETIERRRIVSPEPYRKSPGRWSRSPSRESWKYRRSVSRSPSYHNNHSPNIRNRSVTPPSRRRHSPAVLHSRKSRSRSPMSRNQHENNYHRTEKRSPNRNRGNPPPYNNRNERKFRGHEAHRGDTVRKSNSPRTDDSNYRNKLRTQSPFNSKLDGKKRSTSRSPNQKYPRTNNNSNLRRGRRSPPQPGKRFNPNNNRQNNTNARNRNFNTRRSASPPMNRRNDSRKPPNHQKRTISSKNVDELMKMSTENESKSERNEEKEMNEVEMSNKNSETETTTNVSREKTEQEIEDDNDRNDNSDSEDDDGIDLFASEESESENEGRFKLSSSKSERKTNVATVSFSELGKTAAPSADVLRDLDEVQTDAGPSHRKGNTRRENGRGTRAGNSRRHGTRYNEKRSYLDRERDRNDRGNRERENRDSNKSVGSNSCRRKDVDTDQSSARCERKPITLKSTLNSIESESKRKTPETGMTNTRFLLTFGTI